MTTKQLPSEVNSAATDKRVRSAARRILGNRRFDTAFEHGQWWLIEIATGASWSVVDTNNGFDFEQVAEGDDQ